MIKPGDVYKSNHSDLWFKVIAVEGAIIRVREIQWGFNMYGTAVLMQTTLVGRNFKLKE